MTAGATEPVVKVEVAKGGIEVINPHQPNHAAAKPDTFGVAGWAIDDLGGFGELRGLALVFLGSVVGGGGILAALVLGMIVAALGEGASTPQENNKRGDRKLAQQGGFS